MLGEQKQVLSVSLSGAMGHEAIHAARREAFKRKNKVSIVRIYDDDQNPLGSLSMRRCSGGLALLKSAKSKGSHCVQIVTDAMTVRANRMAIDR